MSFLPATRSFSDINVVENPDVFLRALNKFANDTATAVNGRTIGTYTQEEVPSGNTFNGTQSSRMVVSIPSILNGTTTTATGIPTSSTLGIVNLYGIATNGTLSIPVPYINVSSPSDSVGLSFDLTSASVLLETTTSNWTGYKAYIVVEFGYFNGTIA